MIKDPIFCRDFWKQMFEKLSEEMKLNPTVGVRKARFLARKNWRRAENRLSEKPGISAAKVHRDFYVEERLITKRSKEFSP
jgi:hypothetical protein